jgi:ribosome-associated translation inhibitor RaiA
MIEKEFRKASAEFSSAVNKQVNQKVQKVIRTTKEDATRKAQATVNKSMSNSGAADQFRKDISQSGSGGLASALRAMVEGRVKLK